ncbi:MAG: hypothetical protein HFJ04_04770 [Lachnospiraceae bacterium]|nr:hypothetical protein [Lachnospiraceae bacterium]
MKRRKVNLISSVIWFLITCCWIVVMCLNIYHKSDSQVIAIYAIVTLFSLLRAVFDLVLYKKQTKEIQ